MAEGFTLFFARVVAVPPSRFRPPMSVGAMIVEHSQNFYLNKIIQQNDLIRASIDASKNPASYSSDSESDSNSNSNTKAKAKANPIMSTSTLITTWINLQTHYNCYFDSSKDPTQTSTERVPPGIRQLLEKKEGIFRKHMMGKRVNFACR